MNNIILNKKQSDFLKLVGIITMAIDHIGLMFFPEIQLLHIIGRLAFPIFAYQISLGYIFTSNIKKYIKRLFTLAIISQIPFAFLYNDLKFRPLELNIIFTLLLGVAVIVLYEKIILLSQKNSPKNLILSCSFLGLLILLPEIISFATNSVIDFSYGTYGVLMIFLFYLFSHNFQKLIIAYLVLSFCNPIPLIIKSAYWLNLYAEANLWRFIAITWQTIRNNYFFNGFFIQFFSLGILPLLYGIKKIKALNFQINRSLFYYFYPLHIALLILIKLCLR
ncbi:conjugal transfer protein TraX [Patescibacteria group bacterium]|nr:conjugal transfer protein TraX [Patescibacteria group bacterium]MBU4023338.1 conjugal transfer protein TraX [Patescibacteria group bacterium]